MRELTPDPRELTPDPDPVTQKTEMRLTKEQRQAIRGEIARVFEQDARTYAVSHLGFREA